MLKTLLTLSLSLIFISTSINNTKAETTKLGISVPLSGMAQNYGKSFQQGTELFFEENPDFQKRITVIYDDHKYQGPDVISGSQKMVRIDGAQILAVWGATPSEVIAPVSNQLKVPTFIFTFKAEGKDRPNVISIYTPMEDYTESTIEMIKTNNIKKIGYLGTNIGAVELFLNLVKERVGKLEFEKSVAADETDFKTILAQINKMPVDLLILMLTPQQIEIFSEQAKQQNYSANIVSGDMLGDSNLLEKVKRSMKDVSFTTGSVTAEFENKYHNRYGNKSHLFEAATGYLLLETIAACLPEKNFQAENFLSCTEKLKLESAAIGAVNFESSPETGIASRIKAAIRTEKAN